MISILYSKPRRVGEVCGKNFLNCSLPWPASSRQTVQIPHPNEPKCADSSPQQEKCHSNASPGCPDQKKFLFSTQEIFAGPGPIPPSPAKSGLKGKNAVAYCPLKCHKKVSMIILIYQSYLTCPQSPNCNSSVQNVSVIQIFASSGSGFRIKCFSAIEYPSAHLNFRNCNNDEPLRLKSQTIDSGFRLRSSTTDYEKPIQFSIQLSD